MQILKNGSQKKMMASNEKKMLSTKKAQMVMRGMLNPQIQSMVMPPPPLLPFIIPDRLEPCMAFISPAGTANEALGLARERSLLGSGKAIGGCGRPALSYHAAMRNGSLG